MVIKNSKIEHEKFCYVSPLEVRHFVLDIPVTKSKYQYNAVKFALRPLYPGTEDSTVIDYVTRNKKIIGIASNTERISVLKEQYNILLSPSLVLSQIIKDGIVISAGEGWLELQVIQNNFPVYLQAYSIGMVKSCLEEYRHLTELYNISKTNNSVYLFNIFANDLPNDFKEQGFDFKYVNNLSKSYKTSLASLFIDRNKPSNYKPFFFIIPVFLILLFLDIFLYHQSKILKRSVDEIKNAYQLEKKNVSINSLENEVAENPIQEVCSISDIMKEIYKSSSSLRIISLSLHEDIFKFEAENASAIKVLDNLSESSLFTDVVLHQSLPQQNGYERFVISGKVKND